MAQVSRTMRSAGAGFRHYSRKPQHRVRLPCQSGFAAAWLLQMPLSSASEVENSQLAQRRYSARQDFSPSWEYLERRHPVPHVVEQQVRRRWAIAEAAVSAALEW